jgi:NitT/TauT family transport system substrate-binding protein
MKLKPKLVLAIFLTALIAGIAGIIWLSQKQQKSEEFTGPREAITIGFLPNTLSSLVFIAEEQGFFFQKGLDVTLKKYSTGKQALEGMFSKEVDLAVSGDMAVVFGLFERQDFSVFATIGTSNNEFKIVGHKDRLKSPQELKDKRIATAKGTQMNFFLYLFLLKNGLSEKDVDIFFKDAEVLPLILANGEVDAISTREPLITSAKRLLSDKAVVFEEPQLFRATFNLIAYKKFTRDKPEVIKRILMALLKSEKFSKTHPEQAMHIVSNKIGVDKSKIASDWQESDLEVSLDQSLLLTLEDQARWAIKSRLTDKTKVPNYLNFIYIDGLRAVKPEAVTIIR